MSNTSLELAVRTQNAATDIIERIQARMTEDRGQTAAEYMGLIFVVAVIVLALTKAKIGEKLGTEIKAAVAKVSP